MNVSEALSRGMPQQSASLPGVDTALAVLVLNLPSSVFLSV